MSTSRRRQGEHGPEFHLTQPRLIESILQDLRLDGKKVKTKDTPMASSKLLGRHKKSEDFDGHFNYRRVIGKLNFLEQSTRGDISYATHMCARFCNSPKVEHGEAVKWLGRYLKENSRQGLHHSPRSFPRHRDSPGFRFCWSLGARRCWRGHRHCSFPPRFHRN